MPKLIIIEGLDGSGKSSEIKLLESYFNEKQIKAKKIKLPDYEHDSSALVKMYLNGSFGKKASDVNAYTASIFYAADRFASYRLYWGEDYNAGTLIFADRYATSNLIYQMVKLPQNEWDAYINWSNDLEYIKNTIPKPDLVVYLDMPVEISQRLMSARYGGDEVKKDVHECDVDFLNSCRNAALYTAAKDGWKIINCAENGAPRSLESVHADVVALLEKEIF